MSDIFPNRQNPFRSMACIVAAPSVRRPCLELPCSLKYQDRRDTLLKIPTASPLRLCSRPSSATVTNISVLYSFSILFYFIFFSFSLCSRSRGWLETVRGTDRIYSIRRVNGLQNVSPSSIPLLVCYFLNSIYITRFCRIF